MTSPIKLRSLMVLLVTIVVSELGITPLEASNSRFKGTALSEATQLVSNEVSTDQIIIKYRNSGIKAALPTDLTQQAGEMSRLSTLAGVRLTYLREMSGEAHVLKLPTHMPESEIRRLTDSLMALPDVEYAEPDSIMKAHFVPNDPIWVDQWHYHGVFGVNLASALDISNGGGGPVIAVIDSGLLLNHQDLAFCCLGGYDFITNNFMANDGDGRDADPTDPGDWVTAAEQQANSGMCNLNSVRNSVWHGTHVAGTIGANTNNGIGVAGISSGSWILPIRVLGKCGGNLSDIADGMRWAAGLNVAGVPINQNPARVLNLSLGGPGDCALTYQDAINAVRNVGSVVIVSAGNDGIDASSVRPANCNGVITVAATDRDGNRSIWPVGSSNFGSVVEISAPGSEIWSSLNNGTTTANQDNYAAYNGTSMAAPHVAGTAALVRALRPNLTSDQVLEVLQDTVTPFPSGSTCSSSNCGSGIVNAGNAASDLYVNKDYSGSDGFGSVRHPYPTLGAANGAAWRGAKFKISPGSYNERLTFSTRMTLTSNSGTVVIGR